MSRRTVNALPIIALPLLLAVTGATAQQMDLQSPPPDRSREQGDAAKRAHPEVRPRPFEADLYPHRPAVPYQPGFVEPLTKETPGGRLGVAGWTSPNTPVGSRGATTPDSAGWLGFGFGMEWGGRTITR